MRKRVPASFCAFLALAAPAGVLHAETAPQPAASGRAEPAPLEKIFALPALDASTAAGAAAEKGPVLLHVFATWCEPCRAEIAPLARLARAFDGRLRVVALDVGEPASRVRRFFAQEFFAREFPGGPPFAVFLDEGRSLTRLLRIEALPSSVLLDGAGRRLAFAAGPVDWDGEKTRKALDAAALAAGGSTQRSAAPVLEPMFPPPEIPP